MSSGQQPAAASPIVADSAPLVHLAVQDGSHVGERIRCRRVVTLIGSRDGCKLQLRHRNVSPVHLVIVNNGAHVAAVDVLTSMGTRLNGLKLEHEKLSDGDRIAVDPWEFNVEIEQPKRNGHGDAHPFDLEPTPNLVALEHKESGRVLQPSREICLIGRRQGCDIVIADGDVSRVHALIVTYFGYPAVVDLLTSNRTLVNGEPVLFKILKDHDDVSFGGSQFCVRLLGSKVGEKASNNRQPAEPAPVPVRPSSDEPEGDLIDIQLTEGAERWSIADSLEDLEEPSPQS